MNGKRKILLIIIITLLIILCGIGLLIYKDNNKTKNSTDFNPSESKIQKPKEYYDVPDPKYFSTKEEVMNYLKKESSEKNITVSFEYEEGDCWYFIDSNNYRYSYCKQLESLTFLGLAE